MCSKWPWTDHSVLHSKGLASFLYRCLEKEPPVYATLIFCVFCDFFGFLQVFALLILWAHRCQYSHLLSARFYLLISTEQNVCWALLTCILELRYPLLIYCFSVLCSILASGSIVHVNMHLTLVLYCIFIYLVMLINQTIIMTGFSVTQWMSRFWDYCLCVN